MKLLILSRYDRQGASSRLRTMQYIPYLEEAGFQVCVKSLFDTIYLEEMYNKKRSKKRIISYLFNRIKHLRINANIIWLEYEALPWVSWTIEKLFWPKNTPIITDYDDAIFHRYDQHPLRLVRSVYGKKIDNVMNASKVVIAGNPYLADRAMKSGANYVEIVPTVVDTNKYQIKTHDRNDAIIRIGWIGTPETWMNLAKQFFKMLESVVPQKKVLFQIIGAKPNYSRNHLYEYIPWSEASEVTLVQGMDIGVMPMPDTAWTRGKCGYKLIQYMACGVPVIASPVGVNNEIVDHGVNGYLADTKKEWEESIAMMIEDSILRKEMGASGRSKVENNYSLNRYGPYVANLFRNILLKN